MKKKIVIIKKKTTKKLSPSRQKYLQQKKETQKTKKMLMAEKGVKYYTFVWNIEKFKKIIELAEKENKKPNIYVWEIIEKHLTEKVKGD